MREVFAVVCNDIGREAAKPSAFAALISFSVGALVAFRMITVGSGAPSPEIAYGILWSVLMFTALMGTTRPVTAEREAGTWEILLASPMSRSGIFIAKSVSATFLALSAQLVIVPAWMLLIGGAPEVNEAARLLATLILIDFGLGLVGTLLAVMTMSAGSRDLVGGAAFLPLSIPILVAAAAVTASTGSGDGNSMKLLLMILGYDLVFVSIGVGFAPEVMSE